MTSSLIKKALYFAAEKHDGQYRKGGKVPYIVHPTLVAFGVSEYTHDEEIISAALLHDVVEDCNVNLTDLKNEFGNRVANLVEEVSFVEDKNQNWKDRKINYLNKMKKVSDDALIILAVDKMTNMKAYFDMLEIDRKIVEKLFSGKPEDYYWYYSEVEKILDASLISKSSIVVAYKHLLSSYKTKRTM